MWQTRKLLKLNRFYARLFCGFRTIWLNFVVDFWAEQNLFSRKRAVDIILFLELKKEVRYSEIKNREYVIEDTSLSKSYTYGNVEIWFIQ